MQASRLKPQVGTRVRPSTERGRRSAGSIPCAILKRKGQARGSVTAARPRRYRFSPSQSMPCQTIMRMAKEVIMPFMG